MFDLRCTADMLYAICSVYTGAKQIDKQLRTTIDVERNEVYRCKSTLAKQINVKRKKLMFVLVCKRARCETRKARFVRSRQFFPFCRVLFDCHRLTVFFSNLSFIILLDSFTSLSLSIYLSLLLFLSLLIYLSRMHIRTKWLCQFCADNQHIGNRIFSICTLSSINFISLHIRTQF